MHSVVAAVVGGADDSDMGRCASAFGCLDKRPAGVGSRSPKERADDATNMCCAGRYW